MRERSRDKGRLEDIVEYSNHVTNFVQGISHEELSHRLITSTEKDLRYYLMQRIIEQKEVTPKKLNHWRFVPDEWVKPAIERDRKILFPPQKRN